MRTAWPVVLLLAFAAPAGAQQPATDLAISATPSPAQVNSDQPIVLAIVVANNGLNVASADVQFDTVPLPIAVDKTAGDWSPPASGPEGSFASWYVESLQPGTSATLRLTFKLRRAARYQAQLRAEGATDSDSSNNAISGTLDVHQTKALARLTSHVSPHLLRRPYPPVNIGGELVVARAERRAGWCSGHVNMVFDNGLPVNVRPPTVFGHARAKLHLAGGHCRYRVLRRFGARHPHIRVVITFPGNAAVFDTSPIQNFANLLS
jgi:hypothetical protein